MTDFLEAPFLLRLEKCDVADSQGVEPNLEMGNVAIRDSVTRDL
ncbi:MAG TPA: hypothetical protein VEG64_15080 [Candidatus Sulfotelmatobacter sp.]|nr:hypothetical protein [Candidatus Sulfotelmatobacter sp.]